MARPEGKAPAHARSLLGAFQGLGRILQRIPRAMAATGFFAWLAVIWFVSSRPAPSLERGGPFGEILANLAHAPEYGVLVLWLALALPRRDGWPSLGARAVTGILLVAVLYAVLDEYHQSFTPHRDASAFDVLTDFVGASGTLSCIVTTGGPRASSQELLKRLVLGFFACILAASLATFGPDAWPDAAWL